MDKNKIELALTGDQAIDLMAAALAGVPYAALAYSFKLDEAEVQALIAACQEQGLSAWCQAQQARNDVPAKSPAPAPKVNCTLVPVSSQLCSSATLIATTAVSAALSC